MKLEVLEKNHYYHIYNRGINGESIFISDDNKKYFLKLLSKYLVTKISIFAYCLMDNHYHLIIRMDDEAEVVTQSFSNLFNAYAKAFNKQNNRTGSLFEKHFKRIKLVNEDYLNPKHHLNIDYKDFEFSSYKAILSTKITKVKREEILKIFGDIDIFFCHKQKNLVLSNKVTFE
ncbi:MAG: transposase [Bacteroidetes bacterium]|nr:transposase [Bacteroidota bacterium]